MKHGAAGVSDTFLTGVVLAAGRSRRMGRPKQLLPLGGRPMLQHVVDAALASCLDEIVLVLGHLAEEILATLDVPAGAPLRAVINREHEQGQSTSLSLGLASASPSALAAAILLGDQPEVDAALIDRVAAAFLRERPRAARPVYETASGRIPGHPVFLAREIWQEAAQIGGDRGARALFARHPEWLLPVPVGGQPPAGIDTWNEYESGLARIRK